MDSIIIKSPVSNIKLTANNQYLLKVEFTKDKAVVDTLNPILIETKNQLGEYFNGQRKKFTLPIKEEDNSFSAKVYKALRTINYGETVSYKDIANMVGSPKAYRAVGNANGDNDLSIIIPCHRVIASDGKLGGYSGGLHIKKYLLHLENKNK